MIPMGKGMWIWRGSNCKPIPQMIEEMKSAGVGSVYLKCADSTSIDYASYSDMKGAIKQFRDAGILVYLWQYVYGGARYNALLKTCYPWGASPESEAVVAKKCTLELEPDGFVIDAEKEFLGYKQIERASRYLDTLGNQNVPIMLSSFRFPKTSQPSFFWVTFLNRCAANLPQIYWQPGSVVTETVKSIAQFKSIPLAEGKIIPIIPVGRAYIGDGHPFPTETEVS